MLSSLQRLPIFFFSLNLNVAINLKDVSTSHTIKQCQVHVVVGVSSSRLPLHTAQVVSPCTGLQCHMWPLSHEAETQVTYLATCTFQAQPDVCGR